MALSDSMFLFEIILEELNSYIDCNEFYIKSQFADLFNINLKDPNDLDALLPKPRKKNPKRKTKVRNNKANPPKDPEPRVQSGQTLLLTTNIDMLMSNMKQYPMELSLWGRDDSENRLGSTHIPWSDSYIDYLSKLRKSLEPPPIIVGGTYNVFNEYTSRCMANIRLVIKLSYFKDKITSQFRALSENNQRTFIYTGLDYNPTIELNTVNDTPTAWEEDPGVIKTIYSGGKQKFRKSSPDKRTTSPDKEQVKKDVSNNDVTKAENNRHLNKHRRSETDIEEDKQIVNAKSKSCSSIGQEQINILDYIFNDDKGPFGNQIYCVNYFTVDNDFSTGAATDSASTKPLSSVKSHESKSRYQFKVCSNDCKTSSGSVCSLDLPHEAAHLITVAKCKHITCDNKKHKEAPAPSDYRILLDLSSLKKDCCDKTEKVEQVVGGMTAKMKINADDPCYCECECKFGFVKRTQYCNICGGYEITGEDLGPTPGHDEPFPCPIYHKLEKKKTYSNSGSEGKKKDSKSRSVKSESERDCSKKGKKRKIDERFKFNYGYTAPKIGHSQCGFPCTGTLGAVPKNMGWLWTAENVPGLKFRPLWRPGATNKHVVRLLRMAKNPGEVISKKKKKVSAKKKSLKRPLLVVHKKNGEYTVTMEPVKQYPKQRTLNQYPYEDKPALTYTIGRTEEENLERQRKKERSRRRLERDQREFIQSAFRDMCQEICLKTYQQALGILPETENPTCPCYPAHPGSDDVDLDHSCSCSEDKNLTGSDTDSDEWIVEFTPPNATFDPTFKSKKVTCADNTSQYTYVDYRVKLLDRYGNPVPRFFKGPDGKQQCSDLGGFWGPNHKWLEINVDGYIASDQRWAPHTFIGPTGETVESETGKFQNTHGKWLYVGIDGYIDAQGRWKAYPRPLGAHPKRPKGGTDKKAGRVKKEKPAYQKSEATFSCFGDASPAELSKMGIVGHGPDKKLLLAKLRDMLAQGENVQLPVPSTVPRRPPSRKKKSRAGSPDVFNSRTYFEERTKCRHPVPSEKGVIATDELGNKTYFRLKERKNKRPADRFANLTDQGISLSSFHAPCFHSFISTEIMKKQQYNRIRALYAQSENKKHISTQEISLGWKPGAISKRLLRKLNKAKQQTSPIQRVKPTKKTKKHVEDKPTLIISKMSGEYRVEMQVSPENSDTNIDQCSPLIYKIVREDNDDRIKKRQRKQRRLIREAVGKVWSDPYHPEVCEKTCLKAYKQAIGVLPYDPNKPECICTEEEAEDTLESCSCEDIDVSSQCSSLELDWEIHFTPPYHV